jgi:putative polyhydroxyalkanoate system protein
LSEIRIHRDHELGLAQARRIAERWADEARQRLGMDCSLIRGEYSDTVEFSRSGVQGRLVVAADHFDLQARLGFLLGAFSARITREIEGNLDRLLGAGTGVAAPAPARSKAARRKPTAAPGPTARSTKPAKPAATPPRRPARKAARGPGST